MMYYIIAIFGIIALMSLTELFLPILGLFLGGVIGYMIANEGQSRDDHGEGSSVIEQKGKLTDENEEESSIDRIKRLRREGNKEHITTSIERYYQKEIDSMIKSDFDPEDPEIKAAQEELREYVEKMREQEEEEAARDAIINWG